MPVRFSLVPTPPFYHLLAAGCSVLVPVSEGLQLGPIEIWEYLACL